MNKKTTDENAIQEYQGTLENLNNLLANIRTKNQDLVVEARKMIEQIEKLKREGVTPVAELTKSLRNTNSLLQGKMTPEHYQIYAKKVEESSTLGMKILGGLMIALGLLLIVAGIIATTEGFLLDGFTGMGLGLEVGLSGLITMGIFNEKNKSSLSLDNMNPFSALHSL